MVNENIENKDNFFKSKYLAVAILLSVFVGVIVYNYKPQEAKMKLDFPYAHSVDPNVGINCKALVGSMMYGSNTTDKGIHAELFKGTDAMAIELDDEGKFSFITKAAIGIGQAKSDEDWKVALNNEEYLIAILDGFSDSVPIQNYTDTFMLNKENGTAIWTKNRVVNLGTDTPMAQSYLLK